jgi:hypothetical protein
VLWCLQHDVLVLVLYFTKLLLVHITCPNTSMFMRMGFSAEATAAAILAEFDREDLTVGSLQYLYSKGIKTQSALLCKPGGIIDGPAPAGGATIPWIPNPGVYLSTRAEVNMVLICCMVQHYAFTLQTLEVVVLSEAEQAYRNLQR